MIRTRIVPVCLLVVLLAATSAVAQPDKPWKRIYPHISGGIVLPQSDAGDALDSGWNLSGGVTIKKQNWPVAFVVNLGYNDTEINISLGPVSIHSDLVQAHFLCRTTAFFLRRNLILIKIEATKNIVAPQN